MQARHLLAAVCVITLAGLVGIAPAAAVPVLTVTPDSNLVGGQYIAVEGSGFTPGVEVRLCSGVLPTGAAAADPCSQYSGTTVVPADGILDTADTRVQRFIYVASLGRWIDCADASENCAYVAYETGGGTGTAVTHAIHFAAPPPPPAQRGSITLTPSTALQHDQNVGVSGHGFRPNASVEVVQCIANPHQPSDCARFTGGVTYTESDGSFESGLIVSAALSRPGLPVTSCAAPGACTIAAFESVDFVGTVVSRPLTFATDFTISPLVVTPGQRVTVTGVGMPPNTAVPVCETSSTSPIDPELMCPASAERGIADVDANGRFTTTLRIDRSIVFAPVSFPGVPGTFTPAFDCAVDACVVKANFYNDGIVRSWPVVLAPTPPPPTSRGSIVVVPSVDVEAGSQVTVSGIGFRSGAAINVLQCRPAFAKISDCNVPFVHTTADASGGFTAVASVSDYVYPSSVVGGTRYDCAYSANACVVAAAEDVDFSATVVSVPVPIHVTPQISFNTRTFAWESQAGASGYRIGVSLSRPVGVPVSVDWHTVVVGDPATVDATPSVDYTPAAGTLTFAPGETQANVTIPVNDDHDYEMLEAFGVAFDTPVNAVLPPNPSVRAYIREDDGQPIVRPGPVSVNEGDTGAVGVDVTVNLSGSSYQTIAVPWKTVVPSAALGPPATSGVDFTAAAGTITFAPGETSKRVTIAVNGDREIEPNELFGVSLSAPTNATGLGFLKNVGFVTIRDDDTPTIIPGTATVIEGDTGPSTLEVPVTLSTQSSTPVTVTWGTGFVPGAAGAQATPDDDYGPEAGTVTIAPGETSATVSIAVNGDEVPEVDEYVLVAFGTTTPGVRIGGIWGLGFGIISNDDL